jgi:hypothetical protein
MKIKTLTFAILYCGLYNSTFAQSNSSVHYATKKTYEQRLQEREDRAIATFEKLQQKGGRLTLAELVAQQRLPTTCDIHGYKTRIKWYKRRNQDLEARIEYAKLQKAYKKNTQKP